MPKLPEVSLMVAVLFTLTGDKETACEYFEKMCRLKQNILSVPIIVQSKLCSFFATLTRDEVEWVEMEVEIGDSCISM